MSRRGGRRGTGGPSVRVVAADGGRTRMLVDGLEAAVVDRADPRHLDFPYMRWIADVERPAEADRGRYQLRLEDARQLMVVGCAVGQ